MEKRLLLLSVGLLALVIVGCSVMIQFPAGTYEVKCEGRVKTITFWEDGTWQSWYDGESFSEGTYSIHGDMMTWDTDQHCDVGGMQPATYTWLKEGDFLTFQVVGEDPCLERLNTTDGANYRLVP